MYVRRLVKESWLWISQGGNKAGHQEATHLGNTLFRQEVADPALPPEPRGTGQLTPRARLHTEPQAEEETVNLLSCRLHPLTQPAADVLFMNKDKGRD